MGHVPARNGSVAGWVLGACARVSPGTLVIGTRVAREATTPSGVLVRHGIRSVGEQNSCTNRFFGMSLMTATGGQRSSLLATQSSTINSEVESGSVVGEQAPPKLTGAEIREKFLSFYESRSHQRLPSSSLVPDDPTVLLTIAGMLQFKPVFLGQAPRQFPRATTTQKCVRTNDIENVGVTTRHHTFFEMLGNFSFGDYFKKEAIVMAWELSTREFKIPENRIWVSVYKDDDDGFRIWRDSVGIPEERIQRCGDKDNFWALGPTGPCGPCSELYYDCHPEKGIVGADVGDDTRFVEFYNLVFMDLNRGADGKLTPLKNKNVDTGMGLERVAQILQGVPNNYETDLIFPIIEKAASLANVDYTMADTASKMALKVMGDHTRAVTYLISDGVRPSNIGRGYVVRRLIRRIIMKAQLLGIQGTLTPALAEIAISLSDGCDPAVKKNSSRILITLKEEEEQFSRTLTAGQKKLKDIVTKCKESGNSTNGSGTVICGEDAFMLFDTYGFPLELTQEVVASEGMQVDMESFEKQMELQRQRSKQALEQVDLNSQLAVDSLIGRVGVTQFLGYSQLEAEGRVVGLVAGGETSDLAGEGAHVEVIMDRTPFYAESGGQVGDRGFLNASGSGSREGLLRVNDVQPRGGGQLYVHKATIESGSIALGDTVSASVDPLARQRARCNHTATHLLQAALKKVLGDDTSQQGSLVDFQRLRFDFNLRRGMTESELEEVETLVNSWIEEAHDLVTNLMPLEDAKAAGAIAMFGEKYADIVRVVNVPGVSMELCGGTHVQNTFEIGGFKIVSESAIQSGIRRIEAVAGPAVIDYLKGVDRVVKSLKDALKVEPDKIPDRVAALQQDLLNSKKEVEALQKEVALAKTEALASQAVSLDSGATVLVAGLEGIDGKSLQDAAQKILQDLKDPAAVLLGSAANGRVSLVAALSPAVVSTGLKAGELVGEIAKICGGGGGGRPNLAQAGGKQPEKLVEALDAGKSKLMESLTSMQL